MVAKKDDIKKTTCVVMPHFDILKYVQDVVATNPDVYALDECALMLLANNLQTYKAAVEQIEREGYTFVSDRGNISVHPMVKVLNDAQKILLNILQEFHLTPRSRCKKKNVDVEETSPLEELLKGE
jgi:P27 family predicted phage terminase small subunit